MLCQSNDGMVLGMGRYAAWRTMLIASIDEACLAVRLYNDPAEARSFESFVVHMHLAWLYLLHAVLTRDGVDYRYWENDGKRRRLIRVDGEPKRWELARCVQYRWPNQDPVRANLDFFIALRNKIEHRYGRLQETLALAVGGHSQALLINYEEDLTSQFGADHTLAARLRFPVFVGTFTQEGEAALLRMRARLPKRMQSFIADFSTSLDPSIQSDQRFEFRVHMTLELAKEHPEALAIRFTRYDDMTDEQKAAVEELGKRGQVVVREHQREVSNLGWLKPTAVVQQVREAIPYRFTMNMFVKAYKAESIRPTGDSKHPHRTDERYCRYDEPHRDYIYSAAYKEHLIKKLSTAAGFQQIPGIEPELKPQPVGQSKTS